MMLEIMKREKDEGNFAQRLTQCVKDWRGGGDVLLVISNKFMYVVKFLNEGGDWRERRQDCVQEKFARSIDLCWQGALILGDVNCYMK